MMANSIEIWLVDAGQISRASNDYLLDQDEQARAASINNASVRDQYVRTRIVCRRVLGSWLNIDPTKIAFRYQNDRPICTNQGAPNFSLSKRDNWIAMAISAAAIGIDLEKIDLVPADQYVMEELFGLAERTLLSKLNPSERPMAYAQMWTQKEAYSKATGHGLDLDFAKIHTRPDGGLIESSSGLSVTTALYGHQLKCPRGYVLSVVTPHENPDIKHNGDTM